METLVIQVNVHGNTVDQVNVLVILLNVYGNVHV